MRSPENPFATRFTRPGAIPFVFRDGTTAAEIVDRFLAVGRRGQVVGPHGSGKSTLLAALASELRGRGIEVAVSELHDGQRRLPRGVFAPAGGVLVVDGYEQLGRLARMRLAWEVRRRAAGLIVTAHDDVGYPTLHATHAEPDVAAQLVAQLLAGAGLPNCVSDEEVRNLFDAEGGNVREVFFRLYDLYESRRS